MVTWLAVTEKLCEKLPTPNTLAWANEGLGEIALKSNQNANAIKYFNEVIRDDIDYGATLAARAGRKSAGVVSNDEESVRSFFSQLDKGRSPKYCYFNPITLQLFVFYP